MANESIQILIGRLPDPGVEGELMTLLKAQSETDRYALLVDGLEQFRSFEAQIAILRVVKRVIQDKALLLRVLDIGVRRGESEAMEFWLNSLLPQIGAQEVLNACSRYVDEDPEVVISIWSHIAQMVNSIYPELEDDLVALSAKIDCMTHGVCDNLNELLELPPESSGSSIGKR